MITPATSLDPDVFGAVDTDVNELLLFHGTKPSSADLICSNGFKIDLAGSKSGTLYGNGVYFAEKSSKSDEYAEDDMDGTYSGLYAMLLCRVTCGKVFYNDQVRPDPEDCRRQCVGPTAKYNCVLGDREKARGTYREFIIYDQAQAYPEFLIIYRRDSAASFISATPSQASESLSFGVHSALSQGQ
jgi:hypothetical protein